MRMILDFFIHKARTLRVSILTLFLSLFVISFIAIAIFTNSGVANSVEKLSRDIAKRFSAVVLDKFQSLGLSAEMLVQLGASLDQELGKISFENKQLLSLMLNLVRLSPNLTTFLVAQEDGTFIAVIDLSKSLVRTYQNDRNKPLPPNAAYSIRILEKVNHADHDAYYYLDPKFALITSETLIQSNFDPTKTSWYVGAEKNKDVTWTDFYTFPTGENGITVSYPVVNGQGKTVAVAGADLSLVLLSRFLTDNTVGKMGRAFIIDDSGKIIFPQIQQLGHTIFSEGLVTSAFQYYLKNHWQNDFLFNYNGVEFVSHVSEMPPIFGTSSWNIVIMAPFDEFFFEILKTWQGVLGIMLAILIIAVIIVVYFSQRISSPIVVLSNEIDELRNLQLEHEVRVKSNVKEIILMDNSVAAMRRAIRSIARYVPKDIVRELFQKGKDIVLGGEKKEITIFFSDVAGFTAIAESQPIDILLTLLEEYFDFMSKIILEAGGTIDKYMGDGIMAFWGAPISMSDHASKASIAALRCHRYVNHLNRKRKAQGKPEFRTRFGINTGTVIVGNIGTNDRMNYTVIGDAVNTTFRLQDIDKFYHTNVIIGDEVRKKMGENFVYRPLDVVAVKGKTEKTKIYELIGIREGDPDLLATPEEIALCEAFAKAYESFYRKEYGLAKSLFASIAQKYPDDYPTSIYLERLKDVSG